MEVVVVAEGAFYVKFLCSMLADEDFICYLPEFFI
jgi:hypothetical protein